jgi:4-hydroxybenzoate polyprenyltransferase
MKKLLYFVRSIRWFEIAVRTGAPVIAVLIAAPSMGHDNVVRIILGFAAFYLLWIHGYTFNEWGGYYSDKNDASKSKTPVIAGLITRRDLLILSIFSIVISVVLYTLLDTRLLAIILFDVILGIAYVHPRILLKNVPVVSFLILLIVSINDFLLGWLIFSSDVVRGLLISIFFGMLGITGQHFHEAGDHDSDKRVDIKTNAVRFGKKNIFVMGFIFYTLSILYFIFISVCGFIPNYLYLILVLTYPVYALIFYKCLKTGITTTQTRIFIKRYRFLYGFIGACFLVILLFAG